MKTRSFILCAAAMLLSVSINASAQTDELEPGIYAIVDGEAIALSHVMGITGNSGTEILGVEIGKTKTNYKGAHAETCATGTFVMVINPEKKALTRTPKKYDPFIKTMTPDNILFIPLTVNKNKRTYEEGVSVNGINTQKKTRIPFEWEQTGDNSFTITTEALAPGEYGIVFKPAKLGGFDYSCIFEFYVAEP